MLVIMGGSLRNEETIIMLGSRCPIIFMIGFLVKATSYACAIFRDIRRREQA